MHHLGYLQSSTTDEPITIDQMSRFQHTYVIGQTGTGKSTFSVNSFLQDVHAGFGACYFDFHGQDAPSLLDHILPDRIRDVIYVDPLSEINAIGYHVLDGVRPGDYATFTDEIVGSLKHIHSASWGARMDDILTNAIRPLFDLPAESKGTLLGAVRMLNDPYYRKWVISHCPEKTVQDFWQMEFASWSKGEQGHNVNSSLNKIRRFQSAPILRRILGQQRSRINFARAIDEGQILIFDLNKHHMGAVNANTLASLILSRLIYEGTRRTIPQINGTPAAEMVTPFHIYVDEFHSVTSLSTVEALSGIRKFRIGLTLAHQYTDQLPLAVLDAIKGNVGTKLVFRIGGDDAERLYKSLDMSDPSHLTDQPDYAFFASLKEGRNVATKQGYTVPPAWEKYGHGAAIKSLMASKYARPVAEVDATYERWQTSRHYGGVQARPTVKKKQVEPSSKGQGGGGNKLRSLGSIMLNGGQGKD